MTPGCTGTTKGVPGANEAYASADTNIPTKPFCPPPSVHSTLHVLALQVRRSEWSCGKSGSPEILSRILCSKISSFRSVADMFGT